MPSATAPESLQALAGRFDAAAMDLGARRVRIRLGVTDGGDWDALVGPDVVRLGPAAGEPDAILTADAETWGTLADDLRAGMRAFRAGRLRARRNLHLAVGFLAATSGLTGEDRLSFETIATRSGRISAMHAGTGPPVLAIHGLGGTKASFLPTVEALAGRFRVTAIDLPGFGDSSKPVGAAYDARFFANAIVDVLAALGLERAHLIGNSLGGRIALEVGMRDPGRVGRLALLAPSLAWKRERPWAGLLKWVRPELGLLQPAPRPVVEGIVKTLVPEAARGWAAAGVDEFLRAFLEPQGRAAFYAAARQIYLEDPEGPRGFWPRLHELKVPALFVWGRQDRVVPIAFQRHVTDALPAGRHLELDCGHVPQLERPHETHEAIAEFFGEEE